VKNSNANEKKELISRVLPKIRYVQRILRPSRTFFENHFNFNFNFFATPWLSCLGTHLIASLRLINRE